MADEGVYGRGLSKEKVEETIRRTDTNKEGINSWTAQEAAVQEQYAQNQEYITDLYNKGEQSFQSKYRGLMEDAYVSSQRNRQLAANARLVGQGAAAYNEKLTDAYQQAYTTYQKNLAQERAQNLATYQENQQTNLEQREELLQDIQQRLSERAENFTKLGEAHYDYAQYLFDTYDVNEGEGPWDNKEFKRVFLTDDGEGGYRLKTKEELYNSSKDDEGVYTSVYDEEGNLTKFGTEYFDILENFSYGDDTDTFGEWLAGYDEELSQFANERDIYNITGEGNLGTFKQLSGRDAKDYSYSVAEHFGAMSQGTIKSFFKSTTDKLDSIFNVDTARNADTAISNSVQIIDDLQELAEQLGILPELERDYGFNADKLKNALNTLGREAISGSQIAKDQTAESQAVVAATTAAGAAAGPWGAFFGGIVGFFGGIAYGHIHAQEKRENNKKLAAQAKKSLQDVIDMMVAMSINKREQQLSQ